MFKIIFGYEKLKIIQQIKLNKLNYIKATIKYQELFEIQIFLFVEEKINKINN